MPHFLMMNSVASRLLCFIARIGSFSQHGLDFLWAQDLVGQLFVVLEGLDCTTCNLQTASACISINLHRVDNSLPVLRLQTLIGGS